MHVFSVKMNLYKTVALYEACWLDVLWSSKQEPSFYACCIRLLLCATCDLLMITSTSSDLGSGLRVGPGQSPELGLCDMISALLLSLLLCGLSHVTPLWE